MYIEREKALTALSMSVANAEYDECEEETVKHCMRVLHKVPAADAAPVVHGEWKSFFDGKEIQCSVCTTTFWNEDQANGPNYCPNCGAKMGGGGKE